VAQAASRLSTEFSGQYGHNPERIQEDGFVGHSVRAMSRQSDEIAGAGLQDQSRIIKKKKKKK
jgi:hypothetical protein